MKHKITQAKLAEITLELQQRIRFNHDGEIVITCPVVAPTGYYTTDREDALFTLFAHRVHRLYQEQQLTTQNLLDMLRIADSLLRIDLDLPRNIRTAIIFAMQPAHT